MGEVKFQLLIHLQVGKAHPHGGQPLLAGVDSRINLGLRPVLGALLPGNQLWRQGCGFDFVNRWCAVCVGKDTVGTALQHVGDPGAEIVLLKADFRLIVRVLLDGGALQLAVQTGALQRTVKAGKAAVDAAGPQ